MLLNSVNIKLRQSIAEKTQSPNLTEIILCEDMERLFMKELDTL